METFLELLIHAVKATRYRFVKATAGANPNFGAFQLNEETRSPREIVNHMCDLAHKTRQMMREGNFNCPSPVALGFSEEKERFLECLDELEALMQRTDMELELAKRLLQGPILDMATHVGQLAMLSGLSGNKVPKESYYDAPI